MMYWIYDYPGWIIGALFCGTPLALTWLGIFLTRATVHSWLHQEKRANEMVGTSCSSASCSASSRSRLSRTMRTSATKVWPLPTEVVSNQ